MSAVVCRLRGREKHSCSLRTSGTTRSSEGSGDQRRNAAAAQLSTIWRYRISLRQIMRSQRETKTHTLDLSSISVPAQFSQRGKVVHSSNALADITYNSRFLAVTASGTAVRREQTKGSWGTQMFAGCVTCGTKLATAHVRKAKDELKFKY
jgi:hypothetical protein